MGKPTPRLGLLAGCGKTLRDPVILSEAKNLALQIKDFRDSSSPAAPQNDILGGFFRSLLGALVAFILLASASASAQEVRLYLKDGSYQLVKSYQITGDRVRYYSLDRSQWEEVPKSLVDFEATRHAQQQEAAVHEKGLEEAKELEKQHFDTTTTASTGFQVAPGLTLPDTEGVYACDGLRVIPLIQSEGEIVTDRERQVLNLALPAPLLKKRALVALPGPHAAVRITVPQPVFYIQANDGWGAKAELIPVKSSKTSRVVEKVASGVGVGASGEQREGLPLQRAEVTHGVFKLQPAEALAPGEYVIGELVDGKLNLDVWDFGIDRPAEAAKPEAAPNPEAAPSSPAMTEQRPGQSPPPSPASVIPHPATQQGSPPPPNPPAPSSPDVPNPPN
jgi:hypothetical protein